MARLWRFRITLLLVAAGSGQAWAETIEFVTYYPAPTAQGSSNMQAAAIGNGYNGTTPDDGELLVFDRVGIGPGFDVAQPAPRLDIRTGAARITMDVAADPAQQLLIRGATDNGEGISVGFNTTGNFASIQSYAGGAATGNLFLNRGGGNVGIGTWAAATGKLVVVGAITDGGGNNIVTDFQSGAVNAMIKVTGTTASALLGTDVNGDAVTGSYTANRNLRLLAGNGERVRVTPAGNVGIGTTSPSHRLHVYEPTANVWTAKIQGNTHGLYGSGSTHGLYGYATGGGHPVYGTNGSYGNWASLAYSNVGMYAYTPQANWASIASGSYYGSYGYGRYYGGYFQNGNYWSPALFAYNGGSGYWSYIGHGYFGLYTNGYVYGYLWNASSIDRKKNVATLSPQEEATILSRIQEFPLVRYRLKTDSDNQPFRLGVIAEWTPRELTSEDGKAVDVSAYATYSLAGVKALSAQVKQQQEEIQELKRKVQQLQEKNTL